MATNPLRASAGDVAGRSAAPLPADTVTKLMAFQGPLSRDQVRQLQQGLAAMGINPGPIDGLMGPRTQAAMQQWQVQRGMAAPAPASAAAAPGPAPQATGDPGAAMAAQMQAQYAAQQQAAQQQAAAQRSSELDAIARQLAMQEQASLSQQAFSIGQENFSRAQQRQALLGKLNSLVTSTQSQSNEHAAQMQNTFANRDRTLGEVQRQGVFDRANLQDRMIGGGLGQSGIRLGAEGRQQTDLVKRQGDVSTAAQQQWDAIARANATLAAQFNTEAHNIGGQYATLPDLAVPTASSLEDLIRKYRQGLGS